MTRLLDRYIIEHLNLYLLKKYLFLFITGCAESLLLDAGYFLHLQRAGPPVVVEHGF